MEFRRIEGEGGVDLYYMLVEPRVKVDEVVVEEVRRMVVVSMQEMEILIPVEVEVVVTVTLVMVVQE